MCQGANNVAIILQNFVDPPGHLGIVLFVGLQQKNENVLELPEMAGTLFQKNSKKCWASPDMCADIF